MPPKKEKILHVKDEEHFLSFYNEDYKKLVVLDVHQGWCGPCEMLFPTYESLSNLIDDFEKRMDFVMLDVTKLTTVKNDKLNATSRPKFLFILVHNVFNYRKER